jgi:hypothetical protein
MNLAEESTTPTKDNLNFEDDDDILESEELSGSDSENGENESFSHSCTEDEEEYSQQNLFYFQNMDQLLSNYFSNEDVNVVNAIQNLEKSIVNFTNVLKESLEQNAKCTLRVAKILETASTTFSKSKTQ